MLYTRKGDSGTTKDFKSGSGERTSKSSCQNESLGALDELNSFLGLVKVKSATVTWTVRGNITGKISVQSPCDTIHWIQNCLFSVQAEVAGADKKISKGEVTKMESIIDAMEADMPPIKTFFISGGSELAALFDISRTLARTAERRLIAAVTAGEIILAPATLAFINRLSSLMYALARYSNHTAGIIEQPPTYQ
jgi:cob(I)alamin adenosyltransferase